MPIDLTLLRSSSEEGGDIETVVSWQKLRKLPVDPVYDASKLDEERRKMLIQLNEMRYEIKRCFDRTETKQLKRNIDNLQEELHAVERKLNVNLSHIGNFVDVIGNDKIEQMKQKALHKNSHPLPVSSDSIINPLWCIEGYETVTPDSSHLIGKEVAILTERGILLSRALMDYGCQYIKARHSRTKMIRLPSLGFVSESISATVGENAPSLSSDFRASLGVLLLHRNQFLSEKSLPKCFCAITSSQCASSQVTKSLNIKREVPTFAHPVDQLFAVCLSTSDIEKSRIIFLEFAELAVSFLHNLNISCRINSTPAEKLLLCEICRIKLEVYFPSSKVYREVGHISNVADYFSGELKVRSGSKQLDDREKYFVHAITLKLFQIDVLLSCLAESNSNEWGIQIPTSLQSFLGKSEMSYVRIRYKGKGGKILVMEEKKYQKLRSRTCQSPKESGRKKVLANPADNSKHIFAEMFPMDPSISQIRAESICSEILYPFKL